MRSLRPCPGCARHVRVSESTCPFCATSIAFEVTAERGASGGNARLTRAAILFATAAVAASCGGKEDPVPGTSTSSSSGSSGTSSGSSGTSGGPVALYGPAPVDAGPEDDGGGPVALYGPAPVDAGDG